MIPQRFSVVLALTGALLLPVGCATKSFVREEVQQSEGKVGQQLAQQQVSLGREAARVGTLEATLNQEHERVSQVAAQAEQAGQTAGQAAQTAGQALAKAEQTDSRLVRLWSNRNRRELVETVVLTFSFNKWELDDRGETTLLGIIKELKENPTLLVDLEGYTDISGPTPYNVELSQRRVEAVRRFLVEKGIDLPRIQSIGLGPASPLADNKTLEGRRQNRRVSLKIFTTATAE